MIKNQTHYHISIPNPETHYFNVKYSFILKMNGNQFFHMPIWTPGSYKVREFQRNITDLCGNTGKKKLDIIRIDKSTWKFSGKKGSKIEINYCVYAREMTVRTSYLDLNQAVINGASVFIYAEDMKNDPVSLTIEYPGIWDKPITSLELNDNNSAYMADDFDHLIDSPILIGNPVIHSFKLKNKPHRFAITGNGNYDIKLIINDTKKILTSFYEIFSEFPYKSYTFITHLYDNLYGGLEHRDSCHIIFTRWRFHERKEYIKFISLVAHEYFHTFNVKRIRPVELGPFDYQTEHYTKMLWLAEGMTSYYDEHILRRAKVIDVKEYFDLLNTNFTRYFSIPGRKVMSTKESSFLAWIKLYIADENFMNTAISYYLTGGLIGLLLDLKLRELSSGDQSLDDVYKILWDKFKKDGRGISETEFVEICESIAGCSLGSIFKYLDEPLEMDFVSAFTPYGLDFTPIFKNLKDKNSAWLGISFNPKEKLKIKTLRSDGPAGQSGLAPEDEILGINSGRIMADNRDNMIKTLPVGKTAKLLVNRMGDIMEIEIIPVALPPNKFELKQVEKPTPIQKSLYESWLNEKWDEEDKIT